MTTVTVDASKAVVNFYYTIFLPIFFFFVVHLALVYFVGFLLLYLFPIWLCRCQDNIYTCLLASLVHSISCNFFFFFYFSLSSFNLFQNPLSLCIFSFFSFYYTFHLILLIGCNNIIIIPNSPLAPFGLYEI